jgi:hypothetical protein
MSLVGFQLKYREDQTKVKMVSTLPRTGSLSQMDISHCLLTLSIVVQIDGWLQVFARRVERDAAERDNRGTIFVLKNVDGTLTPSVHAVEVWIHETAVTQRVLNAMRLNGKVTKQIGL